jgi:hypothetical protein
MFKATYTFQTIFDKACIYVKNVDSGAQCAKEILPAIAQAHVASAVLSLFALVDFQTWMNKKRREQLKAILYRASICNENLQLFEKFHAFVFNFIFTEY